MIFAVVVSCCLWALGQKWIKLEVNSSGRSSKEPQAHPIFPHDVGKQVHPLAAEELHPKCTHMLMLTTFVQQTLQRTTLSLLMLAASRTACKGLAAALVVHPHNQKVEMDQRTQSVKAANGPKKKPELKLSVQEEPQCCRLNQPLLFAWIRLAMPISVAYLSSLRRMRLATCQPEKGSSCQHALRYLLNHFDGLISSGGPGSSLWLHAPFLPHIPLKTVSPSAALDSKASLLEVSDSGFMPVTSCCTLTNIQISWTPGQTRGQTNCYVRRRETLLGIFAGTNRSRTSPVLTSLANTSPRIDNRLRKNSPWSVQVYRVLSAPVNQ